MENASVGEDLTVKLNETSSSLTNVYTSFVSKCCSVLLESGPTVVIDSNSESSGNDVTCATSVTSTDTVDVGFSAVVCVVVVIVVLEVVMVVGVDVDGGVVDCAFVFGTSVERVVGAGGLAVEEGIDVGVVLLVLRIVFVVPVAKDGVGFVLDVTVAREGVVCRDGTTVTVVSSAHKTTNYETST